MAVEFPRFLQTKQYSAKMLRDVFLDAPLQNGVVGASDLLVTQRGAGANKTVDVAAGSAWVRGTTSVRQGAYNLYNDATVSVAIADNGAAAGNYRIDQIIARVYDSSDGGSAQDIGVIEVVQGTASNAAASATAALNARANVGVLPAHSVVLADVAVVGGMTSITNAVIRDRRPWAHGGFSRVFRNTADYTSVSAAPVEVDATNLKVRMECSGKPITATWLGRIQLSVVGNVVTGVYMDGALWDNHQFTHRFDTATGSVSGVIAQWTGVPAAGSHLFSPVYAASSGTVTAFASSGVPMAFVVEEHVRQNTANNTTTTG